ncbi:MAG: vitamin-B12 independent methionine synthase [Chloroflexi bacterium]|jgi:5-methyltetrahydropteroyltriglutamate--homocysteine methyltransferase|nr:MAG: vitamin-B12 independent methionine synthase [Chloroflexota bacterium]RUA30571.1 MAG: vitamin-B12 independent methionine synthase [Chloroflexota bacterium]HIN22968.1 vitamin-B12 independent methionine synthase [Dehalococcoidia bacterium]|tara:strand:+ start:419 stop:1582 length:1164 start_codon:yes stop_codon:yes gene_type:complete
MTDLPLFPVTVVGSWPRSLELVRALRNKQDGEISTDEFNAVADKEVVAALRLQEEAGVDIVSDGEQRRDNFYSYVVDKLHGMQLMKVSDLLDYAKDRARLEEVLRALDVPAFAIKSPIVVNKLAKKNGLSLDEAAFVKEHCNLPLKVPIPGPYMLTRSAWFEGLSDKIYSSPEALAVDVVAILRDEVLALKEMGVEFIQFDEPILSQVVFGEESKETFMCAALPDRRDPTEELEMAVRLMNETVEGITGVRTGVHVCRGNWSRKEEVLLTGNYGPMLPYLVQMNVDQLVLEFATPRAGEMEVFKEYANEKEIGLGVVNPRTDEPESTSQIINRVKELLQYFDPEKVFLNPDCGFGTFAERNVNDAKGAFNKLKAISEAAKFLRKEYA